MGMLKRGWKEYKFLLMLNAKIDQKNKKIVFHGPGTFDAKERIKSLGRAKWNGVEKSWELHDSDLTKEKLEQIFPNINVVFSNGSEETSEEKASVPSEDLKKDGLPKSFSVSQVGYQISSVIRNAFPKIIYVHGVLSSVKKGSGGRVFMDISEAEKPDETIKCVIWQDSEKLCSGLKKSGFELEKDLQVMFAVEVGFNRKWASVSLNVVKIVHEYTLSKVKAQREITNEKLKKEGVFGKNKELEESYLPKKLGIITSSSGTVINDFMDALNTAEFGFELFWYTASVQGQSAKKELIKGIKKLQSIKDLDAILIFRGGGSAADLSVFNDYDIAKAVCKSKLPVFSAIGHQEDQSSIQDVSYKAYGVPKDLGHYFASIIVDLRTDFYSNLESIQDLSNRLVTQSEKDFYGLSKNIFSFANNITEVFSNNLLRFSNSFPSIVSSFIKREHEYLLKTSIPIVSLAKQICEFNQDRSLKLFKALLEQSKRLITEKNKEIESSKKFFDGVSPKQQLKRGFTIIRDSKNKVITRAKSISSGQELSIEFDDKNVKVKSL